MKDLYRKLNIQELIQANTRYAISVLFFMAFADAAFLPVPVTTFFIFLVLMYNTRAIHYTLSITLGTIAGAVAGYSIGHFALLNAQGDTSSFLQFLFNHIPGFSGDGFARIQTLYSKWDFWIIFSASLTPIPYGVFSISSGLFGINLSIFLIATIISQGLKFFLLAFLSVKLGPRIKHLFKFRLHPAVIIASVCIVIALLATGIIK
jgi:membrane protein YqaA with SNARE-associated domain